MAVSEHIYSRIFFAKRSNTTLGKGGSAGIGGSTPGKGGKSGSCKDVGKYKVIVTAKGNYTGTKTLYFTINPKATSVSKLTKGSKSFKASWSKVSSQATGYQLQCARRRTFLTKK